MAGERYFRSDLDYEPAGSYGYDQAYAASGGRCGKCCGGGGGMFGGAGTDLIPIAALGILAGIAIYLANQLTMMKRKRRGKKAAQDNCFRYEVC